MDMDDFIDKVYTVQEVDQMSKDFIELKLAKKKLLEGIGEIDDALGPMEMKLIEAMKENLKTNWQAHGHQLILKKERYPKLSKDPQEVKAFADYLLLEGGEDGLWSYMSVNHNTLKSYVKQKMEGFEGDLDTFKLPGVDLSFERESLNMRKKK